MHLHALEQKAKAEIQSFPSLLEHPPAGSRLSAVCRSFHLLSPGMELCLGPSKTLLQLSPLLKESRKIAILNCFQFPPLRVSESFLCFSLNGDPAPNDPLQVQLPCPVTAESSTKPLVTSPAFCCEFLMQRKSFFIVDLTGSAGVETLNGLFSHTARYAPVVLICFFIDFYFYASLSLRFRMHLCIFF